MVSQAKIDANRRNARKSTGPRTAQGKERARFNALKHGATAQIPVLPGEDPAQFQVLVESYKANFRPETEFESDLVERIALMKLQFDRAIRVDVARATERLAATANQAAHAPESEAESLGKRLFFDRRGPIATYPNGKYYDRGQKRTSSADVADDPDDPARLIKALQSTGPGCRWLLDRWAELRARLEAGECWQSPEKLKAIRLLGHQPLDAALVRDVRDVFQATYVIDPHHSDAFYELRCDLDDEARKQQLKRLNGPAAVAERPADAAAARALLLALVDRETGRLEPLAEAHRHQEKTPAPVQLSSASIDGNPEGERLRRYALACDRATRSIAASIAKFRKDFAIAESDPFETADAPYAPVTGQADGYRQNEPTAAEWQDRQNEPTAGAPDTVYDVDAAYREAMAAAMALIRNPAAGPQGINMDRLEQAIVANAQEALRIEDLDNEDMGNTYPRPQDQSPADLANGDYESAHAETGLRQNEPTNDWDDRQNETTEGLNTAQQNEATDDWDDRQNEATDISDNRENEPTEGFDTVQQNEPTGGWEARQNEPTEGFDAAQRYEPTDDDHEFPNEAKLDPQDLQAEREYRRAAAGLPRNRLEWFQMSEQLPGTSEPAKRRPAFPGNNHKHRRDRRARNQMMQQINSPPAKVSPPAGSSTQIEAEAKARFLQRVNEAVRRIDPSA